MCFGGCVQGVYVWGVCSEECVSRGCAHTPLGSEADTPCGQTDTCENITLPQTLFVGGHDMPSEARHREIGGKFKRALKWSIFGTQNLEVGGGPKHPHLILNLNSQRYHNDNW